MESNDNDIRNYLKNLFQDFEPNPRPESWDEIRRAVMSEDDVFRDELINAFENFEAEPQKDSWEFIRRSLLSENEILSEDLKNSFDNYEPNPQKASWNIIKTALEDDDSLKKDWSNLFADYEVEPQTKSWENIEAAIKKDRRRRFFFIPFYARVGIAASILLLLGFFLFNSQNTDNQIFTINSEVKTQTKSDDVKVRDNSTFENKNLEGSNDYNDAITNLEINRKNLNKNIIRENLNTSAKSETSQSERIINNENLISKTQFEDNKNQILNSLIINQLDAKNIKELAFQKSLPTIQNKVEEPTELIETERKKKNKLIFTSNLMPLSTYQTFTILPQSSTYISQIGQLSALSKDRFGVQARVGLLKPINKKYNVGASFSYTGFQQWANYSFTNGVYDVKLNDNDTYTITPITEAFSEESLIHTLGLKIENCYQINFNNNKIFLIGGGEAVKNINKNAYGYYLNASIGFNYPLAKENDLWIEPTFRYGLTPSFDNNNYLKIQPYHLGLNLRINLK